MVCILEDGRYRLIAFCVPCRKEWYAIVLDEEDVLYENVDYEKVHNKYLEYIKEEKK
jgi:hypothetical protein